MLEVEGDTTDWCLRILRHEAGHPIENAYKIWRRKVRQQIFDKSSQRYPLYYSLRSYSRSFVRHLNVWCAQNHPDEDFADSATKTGYQYQDLLQNILNAGLRWQPAKAA
ncbi:MAG: hypothetical protein FJ244_03670 [Nitrospira sp.]|nr:hypothetical protein [Nitrospira sp.]